MQFSHVGELASSKSAMNTLAPELSALITILRSTGPVISTRRSAISSGDGATCQSPLADVARLGQEVGQLARREARCALDPAREHLAPPLAELALEVGQERERVGREDVVDLHRRDLVKKHFLRQREVLFVPVVALAVLGAGALGELGTGEDHRVEPSRGVLSRRAAAGFTGFQVSDAASCGAPLSVELRSSVEPLRASVDEVPPVTACITGSK